MLRKYVMRTHAISIIRVLLKEQLCILCCMYICFEKITLHYWETNTNYSMQKISHVSSYIWYKGKTSVTKWRQVIRNSRFNLFLAKCRLNIDQVSKTSSFRLALASANKLQRNKEISLYWLHAKIPWGSKSHRNACINPPNFSLIYSLEHRFKYSADRFQVSPALWASFGSSAPG